MITRRIVTAIPFLLLAFLLSGCFPMRYPVRTAATGTVVDAKTGAPLAGAEVFFSRAPFSYEVSTNGTLSGYQLVPGIKSAGKPPSLEAAFGQATGPIVFADTDGRFTISSEKKWMLYIMPEDLFPMPTGGALVILKDGYRPEMRDVANVWPGGKPTIEVNVPMTRLELLYENISDHDRSFIWTHGGGACLESNR